MKYHIGWQRFVEHLNFQSNRKDLSLEQAEALSYMQAYAGYKPESNETRSEVSAGRLY